MSGRQRRWQAALLGLMLTAPWPVGALGGAEFFVVGSVDGAPPERGEVFFLHGDQRLELSVVVAHAAGKACEPSPANEGPPAGACQRVEPGEPGQTYAVSWHRLTPVLEAGDNLAYRRLGAEGLQPVTYRRDPLGTGAGNEGLTLDFQAAVLPGQTGTFYVEAELRPQPAAAPAGLATELQETEALQRRFAGHVVQVVRRADDSYLGFLGELAGTPFIMAPGVLASGRHQTDQRVGSDCAAFAIYGRRRMGFVVPYAGPRGIRRYLEPVVGGSPRAEPGGGDRPQLYRDAAGRPVPVGPSRGGLHPGDIIHFGPQVAVFLRDSGVPGYLDSEDLLLECWGPAGPHETTLRESGFFRCPVEALRWRP